jgi:hypothetical protein
MNIKKSRIIQIIKEEMQKLSEDDGSDDGIAPVSLTRTTQAPAPSDDLATIEMQIHFLEEKLAELQARRAELAGEESEYPEDRGPVDPPEETQVGDTDYLKKVMGIDR